MTYLACVHSVGDKELSSNAVFPSQKPMLFRTCSSCLLFVDIHRCSAHCEVHLGLWSESLWLSLWILQYRIMQRVASAQAAVMLLYPVTCAFESLKVIEFMWSEWDLRSVFFPAAIKAFYSEFVPITQYWPLVHLTLYLERLSWWERSRETFLESTNIVSSVFWLFLSGVECLVYCKMGISHS